LNKEAKSSGEGCNLYHSDHKFERLFKNRGLFAGVQKPDDSNRSGGILNKDLLVLEPETWKLPDLPCDPEAHHYSIQFQRNDNSRIGDTKGNYLSVLPIPTAKNTEEEDYSKMAAPRSLIEDGGKEDSSYLVFWDIPVDRSRFEFVNVPGQTNAFLIKHKLWKAGRNDIAGGSSKQEDLAKFEGSYLTVDSNMERDIRDRLVEEKEYSDTSELVYLHTTQDKSKACIFSYTGFKDKRFKLTDKYTKKMTIELKELSKKLSFEEIFAQLKTAKFNP